MIKLNEVYLLTEDSRKQIVQLLKFPEELAELFHGKDSKHAFALAKAFALWFIESTGGHQKQWKYWNSRDYREYTSWFMKELGKH